MGWTAGDIPDQQGKVVLVTGSNSGLGLSSARALAAAGARVLLACRNEQKAAEALVVVREAAQGAEPEVVALDLADLTSVRACAQDVAGRVDHLDVVMNNAGIMAIPKSQTAQGFEAQFGTNHLGHFALDGLLLPLLMAAPSPRVVTTTSFMHRMGTMHWDDLSAERGYRKWSAYGQSKLSNLLFAYELDRLSRAQGSTLVSVAAHPGYASTHLQAAGPEMAGNRLAGHVMSVSNAIAAQPADMGALPQLYGATMPDVKGGDFYGPGGLFEMRGSPRKVRATRAASDPASAKRLWTLSEQMTGVTYEW